MRNWGVRRCGKALPAVDEAWSILANTTFRAGQGTLLSHRYCGNYFPSASASGAWAQDVSSERCVHSSSCRAPCVGVCSPTDGVLPGLLSVSPRCPAAARSGAADTRRMPTRPHTRVNCSRRGSCSPTVRTSAVRARPGASARVKRVRPVYRPVLQACSAACVCTQSERDHCIGICSTCSINIRFARVAVHASFPAGFHFARSDLTSWMWVASGCRRCRA